MRAPIAYLGCLVFGALVVIMFPNIFIPCASMDCFVEDTKTVDTVFVPGKDSIVYRETEPIIRYKVPPGYVKKEAVNDSVDRYIHSFQDSILTAQFVVYVRGLVDTSYLDYTIKLPPVKEIYRTDTLRISTTVQLAPKRFHQFYVTGSLGGNGNSFVYGPGLLYLAPRQNFLLKADVLINPALGNTVLVGGGFPLFKIKAK